MTIAHGLQQRKVARPVQDFAGELDPVVEEHRLHLRHHRPFDGEVAVAPVLRVLGVTGPLGRDADTAGEAELAVDDEQLAVGAVVEAAEMGPARRVIAADLAAGVGDFGDERFVHLGAADPVEQHVHLDTGTGPLGERGGELAADVARPVDVRLEGDGLPGTANGSQHRREDLVAVEEHAVAVPAHHRRPKQGTELLHEARVLERVEALDAALDLLLAAAEVDVQQSRRDGQCGAQRHGDATATRHNSKVHRTIVARVFLGLAALACGPAVAVESCELNGEHVNPNNGNTTQGKTGVMRCRDGEGGPVLREQELQGGVFMGVVRTFKNGAVEREYRINARGNRDGLSREFAVAGAGSRPVLVREDTQRDGNTIGVARSWYPTGTLKRVGFRGDDEREQASAEFSAEGQLTDLRCGPSAVLAPHFDDAKACGFSGGVSNVVLYGTKGQSRMRLAYERGERRRSETLWDDGSVRNLQEAGPRAGLERTFAADGVKRKETAWVLQDVPGRPAGDRPHRVVTLEQEFHESGKLVQEKRWRAGERGVEPVSEQHWYLNGQPRDLTEYISDGGGRSLRRETGHHDNGRKASEGAWLQTATGFRRQELATGVHRSWDAEGHLRGERSFDDKGRVTRERELDADGSVLRDDEVFGDGSRKAFGK